jgi:hypothetical protein
MEDMIEFVKAAADKRGRWWFRFTLIADAPIFLAIYSVSIDLGHQALVV